MVALMMLINPMVDVQVIQDIQGRSWLNHVTLLEVDSKIHFGCWKEKDL